MKKILISLVFVFIGCNALASEQITALTPSSRVEIELFSKPGAAQSVKIIAVSDIAFPVNVQAHENGFIKVNVEGKSYWLKSSQVRLQRDVVASCAAAAERAERVGSTPGLAGNSCQ